MKDASLSFQSNTIVLIIEDGRLTAFENSLSFLVSFCNFTESCGIFEAPRKFESVWERKFIVDIEIARQAFKYCQQVDFIIASNEIEKLYFLLSVKQRIYGAYNEALESYNCEQCFWRHARRRFENLFKFKLIESA